MAATESTPFSPADEPAPLPPVHTAPTECPPSPSSASTPTSAAGDSPTAELGKLRKAFRIGGTTSSSSGSLFSKREVSKSPASSSASTPTDGPAKPASRDDSSSPDTSGESARRQRRADPRRRASSCSPSSTIAFKSAATPGSLRDRGGTTAIGAATSSGSSHQLDNNDGNKDSSSRDTDDDDDEDDDEDEDTTKFYLIGGHLQIDKTRGYRVDRSGGDWDSDEPGRSFEVAELRWYRQAFVDKEHFNWMCKDTLVGPAVLSYLKEIGSVESSLYRVILRTKDGDQALVLPAAPIEPTNYRESPAKILRATNAVLGQHKFTRCLSDALSHELASWEANQMPAHFKFGVLYARPGQSTEEQWFSNADASPAFADFLSLLGERIELAAHRGYRGGLDTSGADTTGRHAVYTTFRGLEIIFHVSTLLPHSEHDPQQIDKKRHLGNDVVLFLFKEADDTTPYLSSSISSDMIQIVVVVQPLLDDDGYRVQTVYKSGIAPFEPTNPRGCVFRQRDALRDWLLVKAINGELSCYTGFSSLATRLARVRDVQLCDMIDRHLAREPTSKKSFISSLKAVKSPMRTMFNPSSSSPNLAHSATACSADGQSPPASPRKDGKHTRRKSGLLRK